MESGTKAPIVHALRASTEGGVVARRPPTHPHALGVLVGALTAVAVYATIATGLLSGLLGLALLFAVLSLTPTAASFARRLALNGAMFIGWAPILWWVKWPWQLNHGAAIVALGCGVIAGGIVRPSRRHSRTIEGLGRKLAASNAIVLLGGILASAAMMVWATTRTPHAALMILLPGADNYPHFNMFAGIRSEGASLAHLGLAPDGSRWAFYEYPQGFHALAATISEIISPHLGTGPLMLVAYTRAVAAVVVLTVCVVTAAMVTLPGIRKRPAIALPAVTVMWAAFLWQPGQQALVDGFPNFWVGAAAAGGALVLALAQPRFLSLPDLLAIGGLLVACAHGWTPLVLFAAPAGVAVLLRPGGIQPRVSRRRVVAALLIGVATLLGMLAAVILLLRTVPISYLVTTQTGGLHGTSPTPTFLMTVATLFACLRYVGPSRSGLGGGSPVTQARMRALALTPVLGVLVLGVLLAAQMSLVGTTAYYFLKYLMGFELVLAVVTPAVCAVLIASVAPRLEWRRGAVLSVAVTLLATQSFGWFPRGTMPLLSQDERGTASLDFPLSRSRIATGVLLAARGTPAPATYTMEYFPLGPARASNPFYGDAWFHAVQHTLSERVFSRYDPWRVGVDNLDEAAPLIDATLRREPEVRVVVDPEFVAKIRQRLDPAIAQRVVPWSESR